MLLAQTVGPDWISLLQTFGLAVTILFAVAIAVWRLSKWVGKEIVIPLRDQAISRFIAFLDRVEHTVSKVDVNVDKMTLNLDKQTCALESIEKQATQQTNQGERKENKIDSLVVGQHEIRAELMAVLGRIEAVSVSNSSKLDQVIHRQINHSGDTS
jgi:hypothetical protein